MVQSAFPEVEFFRTDSGEPVLRWGILAPGLIAGVFADALQRHTRQRLVAVGSRSAERAERFASDHGAERMKTPNPFWVRRLYQGWLMGLEPTTPRSTI